MGLGEEVSRARILIWKGLLCPAGPPVHGRVARRGGPEEEEKEGKGPVVVVLEWLWVYYR